MSTIARPAEPVLTVAQIDRCLSVHARQLEQGPARVGMTRADVMEHVDDLLDQRLELSPLEATRSERM